MSSHDDTPSLFPEPIESQNDAAAEAKAAENRKQKKPRAKPTKRVPIDPTLSEEEKAAERRRRNAARMAKWKAEHPEEVKQAREANREKLNAAARAAYQANPEERRAKGRAWRAANPEKFRESFKKSREKTGAEKLRSDARARYAADPERHRAKTKRWFDANPEKVREIRQRTTEKHRGAIARRQKAKCAKKKEFIDGLMAGGCVGCGEKDTRCLCFHHRDPATKDTEVSRMVSHSHKRIMEEAAKCDVLCTNCHMRAHAEDGVTRLGPKRLADIPSLAEVKANRPPRGQRGGEYLKLYMKAYQQERYLANKAKCDRIRQDRGCLHCGMKDVVCLQFHHRDPEKRVNTVGSMCGYNTKHLDAEIKKCDVICASCHSKHHAKDRRSGDSPTARKRRVKQAELPFGD